jgi:2-dehydropantoate 2-reductase
MRIVVMGAGAVGGYFGAKLATAGHQVALVARGKHLEALRRNGLRVRSPAGDLLVRDARFTAEVREAGTPDLILFCVKSYDTESASQQLRPVVGNNTVILSLQNGVDNPDKIARLFGDQRTIAAVVYVGAQLAAPGVIVHSSGGRLVLGPRRGADSQAAENAARVLGAAAITCEITTDVQTALWRKLLWNAPFCAISTLTGATVADILQSESLMEVSSECMEEVRLAAQTLDVHLQRRWFDETFEFSKTLGAFKPSMLQDFEARKPLEHDAFNGIVVKLLHGKGKAAAVNRVFFATLQQLDKKIRQEAAAHHHA